MGHAAAEDPDLIWALSKSYYEESVIRMGRFHKSSCRSISEKSHCCLAKNVFLVQNADLQFLKLYGESAGEISVTWFSS